jgi:Cd2+/Zn2+-exporting ATPase
MSEQTYRIGNMDCAHCAQEVEAGVARLDGVTFVRVDFATARMKLAGDVDIAALKARVESLGKTLNADDADAPLPPEGRGGVIGFWDYLLARRESRLALIGAAVILVAVALSLLTALPEAAINTLLTGGLLVTLYPILKSGINGLRINREFNINLLMSIAAFGALFIGEYLEGATVIFLFAIGEALEGYTADRARSSIRGLMALKPTHALRLTDGEREESVPVGALRIGDTILVRPGEGVPMDGEVLSGASGVNQAPITGESVPVAKAPRDTVYAGSINGEGTLIVRVTHLAADNTLSRIIHMVEEAQSVRAPSQRLVDRFAHYYTPAVTLIAVAVAFLPPLLFNAPFYDTPDGHGWLYRALSMLVIACPCALVISTPVTVISAITAAARRGVLIKGGAHLEALAGVQAVAFDKTGTLTTGRPVVTGYAAFDCETGKDCATCDDVLALAAAVERRTTHPLAQAVVSEAQTRQLDAVYAPADSVELLAGRGVRGQIDGRTVTLGSHSLFDAEFPHAARLCDQVAALESDGQTLMLLADGDDVRGYITLADSARSSSRDVVEALHAMNLPTVMLTGDNPTVARAVADAIGVREVRAGLLPADKVAAVKELSAQHGRLAMVGDGINDTPALAAASVGIAMGGAGSPQALETADIALMADDLTQLPTAIKLARFACRLIAQNITISFGMKLVFLGLALFGVTSLWLAILADMGTSLLVTLNGMRPLRSAPQS